MERLARDISAEANLTVESSPAPAIEPEVVNRPAIRRARRRLRVAAFNARGGARLTGVIACLKRPPLNDVDLILLCEADVGMKRSNGRAIAAEIAESLGMSYAYVPEWYVIGDDGTLKRHVGTAILSAAPLEDVAAISMPHTKILPVLWPRRDLHQWMGAPTGLAASIRFDGRRVNVGAVHLHSRCGPAHRERQMAAFLAGFPAHGPAIIGGDMNSTTTELSSLRKFFRTFGEVAMNPRRFRTPIAREPLFTKLMERGFSLEGVNVFGRGTFTYHRAIPRHFRPKLDWFAIRGLKPVPASAAVIPPHASAFAPRTSDHDFVMCEIEL
ncbi:MAG TPA: endonuclease/exonuclease/phosphatase family protein [Candidatus Binataceae bacterium]|nr:endonuclease/exonuclease/phosphatase family protein [Candidatus Binataceae bacterium]